MFHAEMKFDDRRIAFRRGPIALNYAATIPVAMELSDKIKSKTSPIASPRKHFRENIMFATMSIKCVSHLH